MDSQTQERMQEKKLDKFMKITATMIFYLAIIGLPVEWAIRSFL